VDTRQLVIQSTIDPLSRVYNRRGFFRFLKTLSHLACRNKFNAAIMMVDIDHFKKINDSYGHIIGDKIIKMIGELLNSNTRTSDLIGRYGGEEFVIFLCPINPDNLHEVADKLRLLVEQETKKEIPVTISIGAAQSIIVESPETEAQDLIQEADKYLYQAKEAGRNRVISSSSQR
jgi:diguanylate cyclase (GGDEF)-like protein